MGVNIIKKINRIIDKSCFFEMMKKMTASMTDQEIKFVV